MKKAVSIVLVSLLTSMCLVSCYAMACISPASSNVFKSASINAASTGTVTFSAEAKKLCNSINIAGCSLDRLDDGKWVFVASLSVPVSKANTLRYSASMNYSSSLVHGNTYRFRATFSADGETLTRISASIAY